jgi:hypothetical protein
MKGNRKVVSRSIKGVVFCINSQYRNLLLALCRVKHFLCIGTNKGVEEGIKRRAVGSIRLRVRFRSKDAAKPLGLLTPRSKVRRNLNDDIRLGKINGSISNFANANCPQSTAYLAGRDQNGVGEMDSTCDDM